MDVCITYMNNKTIESFFLPTASNENKHAVPSQSRGGGCREEGTETVGERSSYEKKKRKRREQLSQHVSWTRNAAKRAHRGVNIVIVREEERVCCGDVTSDFPPVVPTIPRCCRSPGVIECRCLRGRAEEPEGGHPTAVQRLHRKLFASANCQRY